MHLFFMQKFFNSKIQGVQRLCTPLFFGTYSLDFSINNILNCLEEEVLVYCEEEVSILP